MTAKVFLDTNVWIYFYDVSEIEKSNRIANLMATHHENITISTQILGEVYHVLTRKKLTTQERAQEIISDLITTLDPIAINTTHVRKAIEIQKQTQYSYWDSLVVATALLENCEWLY